MPDKRVILASRRTRNRRKKNARNTTKQQIECAMDLVETTKTEPVLKQPDDAMLSPTSGFASEHTVTSSSEDDGFDDEDDLVFVSRPAMPDFCVEFVPADETVYEIPTTMKKGDFRQFTVRIPSFRETSDGFITYIVAITSGGVQFELERRYSEFARLARALDHIPMPAQVADATHDKTTLATLLNTLPPKTWFRMTQTPALEDRREGLHAFLQTLLAHDPQGVCQLPLVRAFLQLDDFGAQVVDEQAATK